MLYLKKKTSYTVQKSFFMLALGGILASSKKHVSKNHNRSCFIAFTGHMTYTKSHGTV